MFSRQSPSPRYQELIGQNRQLHLEGNPAQNLSAPDAFPGKSLFRQLPRIRNLIRATQSTSMLDYGCGKGMQYQVGKFFIDDQAINETVQDYLNVDYIYRYDAAYPPYTVLPEGRFDAVICTDVLEHCPEDDLPWIVEELFAYSTKLVFANVASYPAGKLLPNGENAHCTQLDAERWRSIFSTVALRHPGVLWEVLHVSRHKQPDDVEFVETRLGTVP
jgi:hypothetical protein